MDKIKIHIKQYRMFIFWLVGDLYVQYKWKLMGVIVFTFAGLTMQTGTVYVCYNYAKALENNTTFAWYEWEFISRSSFFMLSTIATVVMIMTITSAVLVMRGRKIGLQLARDYTDYCSARVYVLTSTVSIIPKSHKNESIKSKEISSLARGDSLSAGMMVRIITFSLIHVGTAIVTGVAIFIINFLLSFIVVFILAITSIFFYKNSIKGAASRLALQKYSLGASGEQKILEDRLSYGVASVNHFDIGMNEIFKKGASCKFSQAFVRQRFVLEENNLLAQIVIGISIFLIILVQGNDTIGQGEDWSALLIYLVAFSIFSSSFARTARMLANINQFYPAVNGYSKFVVTMSKQLEYEKNNSIIDGCKSSLFVEFDQELIELKRTRVINYITPCAVDKYQLSIFMDYICTIVNGDKKKYYKKAWLVSTKHSLLKSSLRESLSFPEFLNYEDIKLDVQILNVDIGLNEFPPTFDKVLSEKEINAINPQVLFLLMLVSGKHHNNDIIIIDKKWLDMVSEVVRKNIFHYLNEKIIVTSFAVGNSDKNISVDIDEGIIFFSNMEKLIGYVDLMNDEKDKVNEYVQKIKSDKKHIRYVGNNISNDELDEIY